MGAIRFSLGRDTHGFEDWRQLDASRVTRRSGRGRDTIELPQYLGADPTDEGNIQRVWQAMRGMSIEGHAISELLLQRLPESIAQVAHAVHGREIARKLAGLAEADRKQRTLGASAPSTLVSGPVDQRFDRHATAHVQGADALGGIEFVAGDRQQIDAELVDVGWN